MDFYYLENNAEEIKVKLISLIKDNANDDETLADLIIKYFYGVAQMEISQQINDFSNAILEEITNKVKKNKVFTVGDLDELRSFNARRKGEKYS
ncbi:hypothetical protein D3C78_1598490 [compost metagenome]